jgi:acetyl-CoA carboxylase biotin carboxyl carrier protein
MTEKQILDLISAFAASGLADLELNLADTRLTLRRYPRQEGPLPPPPPYAPPSPEAARPEAARTGEALALPHAAPQAAGQGCELVTSPIVATFYRSPGPDSPPFVEPGKRVKAGQTLCILEAMKVMNELTAEFDMEILRVLPENGSMVEYGQALFEVRRV